VAAVDAPKLKKYNAKTISESDGREEHSAMRLGAMRLQGHSKERRQDKTSLGLLASSQGLANSSFIVAKDVAGAFRGQPVLAKDHSLWRRLELVIAGVPGLC
jgi:hypothetical protein